MLAGRGGEEGEALFLMASQLTALCLLPQAPADSKHFGWKSHFSQLSETLVKPERKAGVRAIAVLH